MLSPDKHHQGVATLYDKFIYVQSLQMKADYYRLLSVDRGRSCQVIRGFLNVLYSSPISPFLVLFRPRINPRKFEEIPWNFPTGNHESTCLWIRIIRGMRASSADSGKKACPSKSRLITFPYLRNFAERIIHAHIVRKRG